MNAKLIGYWTTLVLFCAAMGFGAVADLTQNPSIMEGMKKLGYPDYFVYIIGFWKLAGVIALLLPEWGLVKEWAYAGLFFDLIGATYSAIAKGGWDPMISFMVLPLTFLFVSYYLWHKKMANSLSAQRTS